MVLLLCSHQRYSFAWILTFLKFQLSSFPWWNCAQPYPAFLLVLGIQAQVLMPAEQEFSPSELYPLQPDIFLAVNTQPPFRRPQASWSRLKFEGLSCNPHIKLPVTFVSSGPFPDFFSSYFFVQMIFVPCSSILLTKPSSSVCFVGELL